MHFKVITRIASQGRESDPSAIRPKAFRKSRRLASRAGLGAMGRRARSLGAGALATSSSGRTKTGDLDPERGARNGAHRLIGGRLQGEVIVERRGGRAVGAASRGRAAAPRSLVIPAPRVLQRAAPSCARSSDG
jgi:hypothetical protein